MKRRVLFVENFARVEKVIPQDLSKDYDLDETAARIIALVKDEVSDNLFDMLVEHLPL